MLPSAKEITDQARKREKEGAGRLNAYGRFEQAYFGDVDGEKARAMDGYGRPELRQMRAGLAQRGGPNMILPIVDDYVALRGRLPHMTVVPWEDDKDTEDTCKRLSRALRSQWLHSNMITQNAEGAWYLTVKGEALYMLTAVEDDNDPDTERGVYITVVDPAACFPRFGAGWNRGVLEDVIIHERYDAFSAREKWGIKGSGDDGVDVYHYIGKTSNGIVIGDKVVDSVDHELGFCPAEWVRTKPLPRDAQSDINQLVDLHAEYRIMFAVMSDSLVEATYAQAWIRNPASFEDRFEIGPGADPIVLKADGAVGRLAPQPPPDAAVMIMGEAWQQITRMSGSAPVRTESQINQSNISGRAISAVQGPMEQRLQLGYEILGSHYERLNGKIMRILYKRSAFKEHEMQVYGTERGGQPYVETFQGDEFRGWTRNVVKFGSTMGGSTHERAVVALNLHDKGLVTGPWVLAQMEVDDPDKLYAQAQDESKAKMQQQMQAQGPPPGTAPPGAPAGGPGQGGAPDSSAPPPGAGGPPQPPPQMPGFGPVDTAPSTPGKGFPGPLPDVDRMIKEAIVRVQHALAGEIVDVQPVAGGVQVTITSFHDKAKIRAAMKEAGFDRVDIVVQKKEVA